MFQIIKDEKINEQLTAYENDEPCDENLFIDIEDESEKKVKMTLDVMALGEIYVTDYGHSILVKCENPQHYSALCEIEDMVDINFPQKVESKNFFNNEAFFLKLSMKNDKYKAKFDPEVNCKDLSKSPIKGGSLLKVECQPGLWLNTKTHKGGMFLSIKSIIVDGGSLPPKKNRKARK
jgi:hypothetical protein